MKVWIDQDLCTGDGLCEEIAPDVFVMDSDGLTDGTFPPQPAKLGSLATRVTQVREHVVRPPEGATELGTEGSGRLGTVDFRAPSGVRGSPCRLLTEVVLRDASRRLQTPLFLGLFEMR